MWGAPELSATLQVGSLESDLEGGNPLSHPEATILLLQPRIQMFFWADSICCLVMLKLLIHQDPQLLFGKAALDLSSSQPELVLGTAPIQTQIFALVGFQEDYTGL